MLNEFVWHYRLTLKGAFRDVMKSLQSWLLSCMNALNLGF